MKKLLQPLRWALPALLLTGFGATAQTLSYATANVVGTYTNLAATGTALTMANTDDANSAPQTLPFSFAYNGATFTQFVVNTNGLIKLGAIAPPANTFLAEDTTSTATDPLLSAEANLILAFNTDLIGGTNPEYRVATSGTAPNRVTTIQWKDVTDKLVYASPQYVNFSFQIKLYETTNVIETVYSVPTAGAGTDAFRFSVVGLKGAPAGTGGPANNTYLFGAKLSRAAWSAATFTGTATAYPTVNFRQTMLPDAGRTFRFTPAAPIVVPANDNPTGAIVLALSATCTPTNSTNLGATTTTPNGYVNPNPAAAGCGVAVNPKDVWFTFLTNASGAGSTTASILVTGNSAGLLRAFSAASAAGPFTQVGCAAGTANNTVSAPLNLTGLTSNTVYYVSVSGYGSGDTMGAFTICATSTTGGGTTAPANDNCSGAIALTVTATCTPITGDNTNATASPATVPAPACGGATTTGANDVWFRVVVPAGGGVTVTTSAAAGSTLNDTVLELFSGTCGSLTAIGCNDDASGNYSSLTATGQTPGATLYARVMSYGTTPTGTFGICATTPAPALANDDPTGAIVLALSATCTPTSSTNLGATTTTPNGYVNPNPAAAGCGVAVNPKDVWFTFTATSAAATITVTDAPAGLLRAFSAASSAGPFTQVGCAAGTANNTVSAPLALTGLTAGTVYYISVSGYGSGDTQGAFTICVTGAGPATCNPVTNLAATSTNNGTGANVTFTPSAGAISYTVTYQIAGAAATTVTPNPTASPVVLSRLTPSRPYLVTVTANCAAGQSSAASSTSFRTVLAAREALGNGSLSVFPNPAQGAFTLTLPALAGERTASVTLLNALGQAVYTRALELNAAGTQARVDVSALAKGIYTLQVKTSTQTATKSVVVE